MEALKVSHVCTNTLQGIIWDTVTYPLWQEYNGIIYQSKNKYNVIKDGRLSERIIWYVDHCHELIDHHNLFLAEINLTRLSNMQRTTCKGGYITLT